MTSYLPWQKMTVAANYATVELFVNGCGCRRGDRVDFVAFHPVNPIAPVLEAPRWIGDTRAILKSGTGVARKLA
jgi:hypothetical protein